MPSCPPPCSTFSAARLCGRPGPGQLRGEFPPDIFGLKTIRGSDKDNVRLGTLLAHRCADVAEEFSKQGKPWGLETPEPRTGAPSVFKLPRIAALDELPGVVTQYFDQCTVGGEFTKPTAIKGNLRGLPSKRCDHELRAWRIPWSGERMVRAHPPLIGTQKAIEERYWEPEMMTSTPPKDEFLSRQAAAYPRGLNEAILDCLLDHRQLVASTEKNAGAESEQDRVRDLEQNIRHTTRLRGDTPDAKEFRNAEDNCLQRRAAERQGTPRWARSSGPSSARP